MANKSNIYFSIALCCMSTFIGIHTAILLDFVETSHKLSMIAIGSFILYLPSSSLFLRDLFEQNKRDKQVISDKMNALNVANMIIIYNEQGHIIKANKNFCLASGYSEQELIGVPHYEICDTKEVPLWKVLLNGRHLKTDFQKVHTKDKKVLYISGTYSPIKATNGRVYQVIQIATNVTDDFVTKNELVTNNAYLEHAAKILRHDMHSGINTYIPRGIRSLERRLQKLSEKERKELNIDTPLKLIREGLSHSQKVYRGVTEFTNLVRNDVEIEKSPCDLRASLREYLSQTSYSDQVLIKELPVINVNEALFCTALDNLIRNGLKYNDSPSKIVQIEMRDKDCIAIIDNGRGIKQKDFEKLSQPYHRKPNQKESGTGLGLNICVAILNEHNFSVSIDDSYNKGTCILIRITHD